MNTPFECGPDWNSRTSAASGQMTSWRGRERQHRSRQLQRWICLIQDERLAWPDHSIQLHLVQDAEHGSSAQATSAEPRLIHSTWTRAYGLAGFDRKFVYNLFFVYAPPSTRARVELWGMCSEAGRLRRSSPPGSGLPITLGTANGGGQAYGEGDSSNFFANGNSENAIIIGPPPKVGVHHIADCARPSSVAERLFSRLRGRASSRYHQIRQPILGLDTQRWRLGRSSRPQLLEPGHERP